jgi:predicted TPR repeat methyltransferase/Flp pilus assembly protein TadD
VAVRSPAAAGMPVGHAAYQEALRFNSAGRLDDAERACRALLRQMPDHVGALRLLANIAYRSRRGTDAAKLLTRATRAAPRDAGVHDELGLVLRELGRLDEAEIACRKALELDPGHAPAHINLAEQFKRRGRLRDAKEHLLSAIRLSPDSTTARISLGEVLVDLGEIQPAVDLYREIIAATSTPAPVYVRLGIALRALGDTAGAIEACQQAVTLAPGAPEAHYHLAETFMIANHASDARQSVQRAMQLPGARVLHSAALAALGDVEAAIDGLLAAGADRGQCLAILGHRLLELGQRGPALECFRRRLECNPEDPVAKHFVAALSGINPDRPSEEYVRQLFDNCAASFDQQLVERLSYSVPHEVAAAVFASSPGAPPWDVLDLGCGTGLVGVELVKQAKSLVGVDLSPKMIERARDRGIYSHLVCGDLTAALDGESCYDVVIAGDVFIYVGRLDTVVPAVRRTLRPGGLLVFTVESAEDVLTPADSAPGYWLGASGRFSHHADYLRELAASHGFAVRQLQKIRIRLESRRPVMGWLAVLVADNP